MKPDPIAAATRFVDTYFPHSSAAWLAGSAARGKFTASSDLDIVVIDHTVSSMYRESLIAFDWRIEAFIHTGESYKTIFESDRKRARPTLPNMIAEGILLRDDGTAGRLKREAMLLLESGPDPYTVQDITSARYFLTDLLDDFIDADGPGEALITLNTLSVQLAEFILRVHGRWIGRGKGLVRALNSYDEQLCSEWIQALQAYYERGDKLPFVSLFDEQLKPYGGRLFEGFSIR